MANDTESAIQKLRDASQRVGESVKNAVKKGHAGTALVAAAALEDRLRECILVKMRPISKRLEARLFEGYGPISSFSARIDLAYALNIIDQVTYDDLKTIKDIRNEFAHPKNLEYVSFVSTNVLDHMKRLSTYKGDDSDLSDLFLVLFNDIYKSLQPVSEPLIITTDPGAASPHK